MSPILLSLVVPIYNVYDEFEILGEELLSFITKVTGVEVLLIDDGSNDGSGDLADNFASSSERITVIHQDNAGLSAARNKGLLRASGKYIWFLDGDDLFNQDTISNTLEDLRLGDIDVLWYPHETFTKFISSEKLEQPDTNYDVHLDKPQATGVDMLVYLGNSKVENYAWSYITRTELLRENNITFPLSRSYEDVATTYKVFFLSKEIKISSSNLVYYRQREGSIITKIGFNNIDDVLIVNDEVEVFLKDKKIDDIKNLLMFKNVMLAEEFLMFNKKKLQKDDPERFKSLSQTINLKINNISSRGFSLKNRVKLALVKLRVFFVIKRIKDMVHS